MKRPLLILLPLVLLSSCATIMNEPHRRMTVYTSGPAKVVIRQDTINTINNRVRFTLSRSKESVSIVTIADSFHKTISIHPQNSFAYISNIICNYGIGMLIDRNHPKRYTYPQRVYINVLDSLNTFMTYEKSNKGNLYLHVSLPYVNSFQLSPENESTRLNTGFWGITLGLDYYHSNNQYLNISASGVTDFFVPVPATVDISSEYELMSSRYLSISNNHKVRWFSFGYGLSYAKNTWDLKYSTSFNPPPTRDPVKKSNNALGLLFSSYYQTAKRFNLGVVYRPTIYRLNARPAFQYEHLLSFDLGWKIRLKR